MSAACPHAPYTWPGRARPCWTGRVLVQECLPLQPGALVTAREHEARDRLITLMISGVSPDFFKRRQTQKRISILPEGIDARSQRTARVPWSRLCKNPIMPTRTWNCQWDGMSTGVFCNFLSPPMRCALQYVAHQAKCIACAGLVRHCASDITAQVLHVKANSPGPL